MRWIFFTLAASLSLLPHVRGEEQILGAAKALEQVQAQVKKPAPATATPIKAASLPEFQQQVQQLKSSLKTIKPAEHAARWLDLADAMAALINVEDQYQTRELIQQLMAVVSPPETWPKLIETLRAKSLPEDTAQRRGIVALHGIAAILANDQPALEKLTKDWTEQSEKSSGNRRSRGGFRQEFRDDWRDLVQNSDDLDPAEHVAKIEKLLSEGIPGSIPLTVPDLISVLGQDKAAALADKLLQTREISALKIDSTATRKLFKQRALALAEKLPHPYWELIEDADDLPLFEAFSKLAQAKAKLTPAPVDNNTQQALAPGFSLPANPGDPLDSNDPGIPVAAENVLLAKLLDEDKNVEVKKILLRRSEQGDENRGHDPFGYSRHRGPPKEHFSEERGAKLLKLYGEVFAEKLANLPWAEYFELASKQNDVGPAKKLVDAALADKKLAADKKLELATQYFDFLLGKELTDDAVRVLRAHLLEAKPVVSRRNHYSSSDTPLAQALKLHLLGELLDKEEWGKEGLAKAEKLFAEQLAKGDLEGSERGFRSLFEALLAQKRYTDAEKLAIDTLALAVRLSDTRNENLRDPESLARETLCALCVVYDELNRRDEVIKLFNTAPWWGLENLGLLIRQSFAGRNIGVIAARAMADAKQTEQALRILDVVIENEPGLDAAYELLIGIDPAGSMKKLETLAKLDPYQERPLIWQAKLLLAAGDVPRAGQVIREAISIDPSDGEQGKNTRMLAYKVLAEVLRKEGDEDSAKIFDGAIAAIRKSERADDYRIAGLHSIARKMYKDSLTLFNDAYCIQSRLAIQLYEAGDLEQAAIHFERAFQLMPNSFGMIESHCFGCEGAFAGEMAQELAEKIFLRLLQEDPKKPQVHYLMGYLRSSQGRKNEALKHYKEAVRLAPRYLNAWEKLADIAEHKPEHAALFDEAQIALLKIDPQQKHSRIDTDEMHDLKKMWTALETVAKERVPPATFSYELAAAKAEQQRQLEKTKDADPNELRMLHRRRAYMDHSDRSTPAVYPGEALSRNRRIQDLQQLLND